MFRIGYVSLIPAAIFFPVVVTILLIRQRDKRRRRERRRIATVNVSGVAAADVQVPPRAPIAIYSRVSSWLALSFLRTPLK
jgi:hypothetical protein